MANEISLSGRITVTKGDFTYSRSFSDAIDMTGGEVSSGIASVSNSAHEAIPVTDIGTAGVAFFRNLDATNYVEIGIDDGGSFVAMLKLKAGECALVRLGTNAPYAKANTAAVRLEYAIVED